MHNLYLQISYIIDMLCVVSHPKLEVLTLITWRDGHGKDQRLEILKTVSARWRDVGVLLGQKLSELDGYQRMENNDIGGCCTRVFSHWIDDNGHSPKYPLSWEGLERLLRDIEHGGAADNLKNALASMRIDKLAFCSRCIYSYYIKC